MRRHCMNPLICCIYLPGSGRVILILLVSFVSAGIEDLTLGLGESPFSYSYYKG